MQMKQYKDSHNNSNNNNNNNNDNNDKENKNENNYQQQFSQQKENAVIGTTEKPMLTTTTTTTTTENNNNSQSRPQAKGNEQQQDAPKSKSASINNNGPLLSSASSSVTTTASSTSVASSSDQQKQQQQPRHQHVFENILKDDPDDTQSDNVDPWNLSSLQPGTITTIATTMNYDTTIIGDIPSVMETDDDWSDIEAPPSSVATKTRCSSTLLLPNDDSTCNTSIPDGNNNDNNTSTNTHGSSYKDPWGFVPGTAASTDNPEEETSSKSSSTPPIRNDLSTSMTSTIHTFEQQQQLQLLQSQQQQQQRQQKEPWRIPPMIGGGGGGGGLGQKKGANNNNSSYPYPYHNQQREEEQSENENDDDLEQQQLETLVRQMVQQAMLGLRRTPSCDTNHSLSTYNSHMMLGRSKDPNNTTMLTDCFGDDDVDTHVLLDGDDEDTITQELMGDHDPNNIRSGHIDADEDDETQDDDDDDDNGDCGTDCKKDDLSPSKANKKDDAVYYGKKRFHSSMTLFDASFGCLVILFQLFVYGWVWYDALWNYSSNLVPVMTTNDKCTGQAYEGSYTMDLAFEARKYNNKNAGEESNQQQQHDVADTGGWLYQTDLYCEANQVDPTMGATIFAFVTLIAIFLTFDLQDCLRAMFAKRRNCCRRFYIWLAMLEVLAIFGTAVAGVTERIHNGNTIDALQIGACLLFLHDMGIRVSNQVQQRRQTGQLHIRSFLCTLTLACILATAGAVLTMFSMMVWFN